MAQLEFHPGPNGLGTKKTWNTKPRDWTDPRPHRLVLDRKRFLVKVKKPLMSHYMIFMRSRGCAVEDAQFNTEE